MNTKDIDVFVSILIIYLQKKHCANLELYTLRFVWVWYAQSLFAHVVFFLNCFKATILKRESQRFDVKLLLSSTFDSFIIEFELLDLRRESFCCILQHISCYALYCNCWKLKCNLRLSNARDQDSCFSLTSSASHIINEFDFVLNFTHFHAIIAHIFSTNYEFELTSTLVTMMLQLFDKQFDLINREMCSRVCNLVDDFTTRQRLDHRL